MIRHLSQSSSHEKVLDETIKIPSCIKQRQLIGRIYFYGTLLYHLATQMQRSHTILPTDCNIHCITNDFLENRAMNQSELKIGKVLNGKGADLKAIKFTRFMVKQGIAKIS